MFDRPEYYFCLHRYDELIQAIMEKFKFNSLYELSEFCSNHNTTYYKSAVLKLNTAMELCRAVDIHPINLVVDSKLVNWSLACRSRYVTNELVIERLIRLYDNRHDRPHRAQQDSMPKVIRSTICQLRKGKVKSLNLTQLITICSWINVIPAILFLDASLSNFKV